MKFCVQKHIPHSPTKKSKLLCDILIAKNFVDILKRGIVSASQIEFF